MSADIFELRAIPNKEHIQNVKINYFDTHLLMIDKEKVMLFKNKISDFDYEEIFDNYNESIRKFNNSIFYLTVSLIDFTYYYNLFNECKDSDKKECLSIWCRHEARNVCCEIFMYVEKIKCLLRSILHFDKKATEKNKDFMNALKKSANNNSYIKIFYDEAINYINNDSVVFINNIRNDDLHNESLLDAFTSKIKESDTQWLETNSVYTINNNVLYNRIKDGLIALLKIKNALQKIIENIEIK